MISDLTTEFDDPFMVRLSKAMLAELAGRLADRSVARGTESLAAMRRWNFRAAWRLHGEAVAYLDASQRALVIARNL